MYSMLAPLARYTQLVLLGKRALWVLAVLLTLILLAVALLNGGDKGARITLNQASSSAPQEPAIMSRPRYQGLDSDNHPFTITADRALQPDRETVNLENVSADIMLEQDAWMALTANAGTYGMAGKILRLKGGVSLFYEGGYEFRTEHAVINVATNTAEGDAPVEGQGRAGILKADSFKVLDRGKVLQFNGNVYVKLYR